MSFKQLGLFRRRGVSLRTGVCVGTVKMRGGLGLCFTVRGDVAKGLGWKTGDRVAVAIGEDDDRGLVALMKSPDGLVLSAKDDAPGKGWGGRFVLHHAYLPIQIPAAHVSEEVAYEVVDGALRLALPPWAYQTAPPAPPVPLTSFRVVENRTFQKGDAKPVAPVHSRGVKG